MVSLGQKIRLFRIDADKSQFDLETALGMGYGSVSRLESGHTIPTRATLKKIAEYLNLNDRKHDYLMGSRETAPNDAEIQRAVALTKELWESKELLVILRDDHFRICAASYAIKDVFAIDANIWNSKVYGRNLISVLLDPELPLSVMFDPNSNPYAENDLRTMLFGFCFEMSYMRLEPDYAQAVKDIHKNEMASKIFDEIIKEHHFPAYFLITQRQVKVNLGGRLVDLMFYTEVLPDSTRFSFIHFFPRPDTFPQV